jgi:hypothetical protein
MYRYLINNSFEKHIPHISLSYIPLNTHGFADILSINLETTLKLRKAKNKINEINNINPNLWEDIKKYTNPYELIYIFNNKRNTNNTNEECTKYLDKYNTQKYKSITTIKPLSRSFFKIIEIIHEFIPTIINMNNNTNGTSDSTSDNIILNSLHIAEGPGGFIEGLRYLRTQIGSIGNNNTTNDKAFAITLVDNTRKNVPAWKQSINFLRKHPEVIISYGADGTGNIYNIDNINSLEKLINKTIGISTSTDNNTYNDTYNDTYNNNIIHSGIIDFITADGGFDYSVDYNYQEQSSSRLIFSEIITALKYQKKGGCFVCKFFDINAYITVEMLYILHMKM